MPSGVAHACPPSWPPASPPLAPAGRGQRVVPPLLVVRAGRRRLGQLDVGEIGDLPVAGHRATPSASSIRPQNASTSMSSMILSAAPGTGACGSPAATTTVDAPARGPRPPRRAPRRRRRRGRRRRRHDGRPGGGRRGGRRGRSATACGSAGGGSGDGHDGGDAGRREQGRTRSAWASSPARRPSGASVTVGGDPVAAAWASARSRSSSCHCDQRMRGSPAGAVGRAGGGGPAAAGSRRSAGTR